MQGIPFVGRAGQLLTQMIEGTAKKEGIPLLRERRLHLQCGEVPAAGESHAAARRDGNLRPVPVPPVAAMQPKAICALGSTAAKVLTGSKEGVTRMRGKWYKWNEIPVMVTYHPSYLLRAYNGQPKREAWEDLKKVLHFVYD